MNLIFRTMSDLVNDLLFGAVLQPLLDLIGNPDSMANVLISLAFDPSPSRKFDPGSGVHVEYLEKFVKSQGNTQSSVSYFVKSFNQIPKNHFILLRLCTWTCLIF